MPRLSKLAASLIDSEAIESNLLEDSDEDLLESEREETESIVQKTPVRKPKMIPLDLEESVAGPSQPKTGQNGQQPKAGRKRKAGKDPNFDVVLEMPNQSTEKISNKIQFASVLDSGKKSLTFTNILPFE